MIDYIFNNSQDLLALLFGLLGVFSVVARLTPTEADNKILNIILKVVGGLGLTKPKE